MHRFPGGVHPPDRKLSETSAIEDLSLPPEIHVPLAQHIGRPAKPVVEKGAVVKKGQLIAAADGLVSAPVHAPTSGTVKKIDTVLDATGRRKPAIAITVDGHHWAEGIDGSDELLRPDDQLTTATIRDRIAAGGVVGAGGATFPTAVKYYLKPEQSAETLIINGVECEPYLTADHRLMLESPDEIVVGAEVLRLALGSRRVVFGVESNTPDAADAIRAAIDRLGYRSMSVQLLPVRYPQGGEKQLIYALTGREVPSGRLPIDVGCVVNNVNTAQAVYRAVLKNRPVVDRVVTVTGTDVAVPRNVRVPLGTPVRYLIEAVGGLPESTYAVVFGGPMTGKALPSLDVAITKGSGGVVLLTESQTRRPAEVACIRCAGCVNACPMGLEPYALEQFVRLQQWDQAETKGILDCIECGCCSYSCPASRGLLDWLRLGKARVAAIRRERVNAAKAAAS